VHELVRYQDDPVTVVVSRDVGDLVFLRSEEDFGRSITSEFRMRVADFLAKGEGPWPWYDLGGKRDGAMKVLEALGEPLPAWTVPMPRDLLDVFDRARRGDETISALLADGADPDPIDPCGATPLWYALRSLSLGIAVALIDAGADAGRRIDLSARGERYTTILHEIVRVGATVALGHALDRGVDPTAGDSDGATPLHVIDEQHDNVNPEIVRSLADAGAAVNAALPGGTQPIESAARKLLPATVAALVEVGASPTRGLDALLAWWSLGARYAGYRADDVVDIVEILRAGGAEVTDRHLEHAARAGASRVEFALRR
jgi:uncharacterized protein